MKLNQSQENKLDEIINIIRQTTTPLKIILFGSAATDEMGPNSDFDLLVVVPDDIPRLKTAKNIYRNKLGTGFAADIIVVTKSELEKYKNSPGLIYQKALNEGKLLYAA
ncbi:MAG: nucleotidyltransferase domain-containing protein [bacterium]